MNESIRSVQADAPAFGTEVAPVSRRTLHDEVVDRIRDMITEGQLAAGARVHEGRLGQVLGVSRTPLREALKFLAREGLIELVPGRGAIVRKHTPKDVRDMLTVLITLESLAGQLACRNASDAEIAALCRVHDTMIEFYRAGNRLEYYKLNQAIHSGIARLSANPILAETHDAIQARLKRIRFVGNEQPANWQGAVTEHTEMIAALQARDEIRLTRVLTQHLEETWHRVKDQV